MSSHPSHQASDAAIARVLQAERDARAAVSGASAEVQQMAERARADARARAERTERRIRLYTAAFARELAAQLTAIEADGSPQAERGFAVWQRPLLDPHTGTPQVLQKTYEADVAMWRQIITEAKIQPN